ncbi:MAG TPA: ABC transporter substrate-binding protein [Thermodesulfobacteriota bacterium]|nr:ABC transporter substrate-binding protein [Thermodesulfobacteriota bacterium]
MHFLGQRLLGLTVGVLLVAIFCPYSLGAVVSASPTEKVRKATEEITSILDEYVKNHQKNREETISKIMAIADQHFDWAEMAKRSLSRFWKERTPDEQNNFTGLFRDLIKNAYIGRIEGYAGEKVVFEGEKVEDTYSVVKTKIITPSKGTEIPVYYRLQNNGGNWMVYDVVIEGVSLVNNYRDQFNSILQSSSYEELVKRIKDKLAQDSKK